MDSSQAPANLFYDAFISYGRADSKAFAARLQGHLIDRGLKVWFDFNDIPLGVDYQNQIDDGITRADNFLFIIAPHSVNSPYCRKEIELAIQLNKRIIPLLHVEQISWETWQQRNPGKSEADWQAYQEQGLHSSFPNMHPVISKINWVYLREGMDDFEVGFGGLTDILVRHQDYVRQHTVLLNQAIAWEQQQKQTRYLLIGEERQTAEGWLKHRFKGEQAPCEPTLLQCEFIGESIKNANNLMTQVFLSYSEVDSAVMAQVRSILLRESITVWTNKTDIQTGEVFEEAICRGIEQADTIVYLLSPDALESQFCQQEIEYAQQLNKRIIPLLIRPTDLEQVAPSLRSLQFIDFTDNLHQADLRRDFDELLKALQEDSSYYEDHKILLSKALKWERQSRNPSILLRGYNLRHAEDWLKGVKQRSQYLPTLLQETFIAESLRQPPALSLDVFISYSRTDSELSRRLNDELQMRGKTTWFDQESIASGTDFQQEIYRGIESADNFLFILSPRSVNSPYCADEVEYAAKLNKRFVTLLHRSVNTAELHPELAKVQWIDFSQGDFYPNLNQLLRTLDSDRAYIHSHTTWLQRAIEWEKHDKSFDLLLRGSEFAIAETWLQEATQTKKQPLATELQINFIQASRDAIQAAAKKEKRRLILLRSLLGVMTVVAGVACIAGAIAIQKQQEATRSEIKALIESSNAKLSLGRQLDALLVGLQAAKKLQAQSEMGKDNSSLQTDLVAALQQAIYTGQEQTRLDNLKSRFNSVLFSPDGQIIATTDAEAVKLWRLDGTLKAKLDDPNYNGYATVKFSRDNQTIATLNQNGEQNTLTVWDLEGHKKGSFGENKGFKFVAFSPELKTVATFDGKSIQLWQLNGGKEIVSLGDSDLENASAQFSEDGRVVVSTAPGNNPDKKMVKFWRQDGTLLSSFEVEKKVYIQAVNQDGTLVLTSDGETLTLQQQDGQQIPLTESVEPNTSLGNALFSPDGQTIVGLYYPKDPGDKALVKLWQQNGQFRAKLTGHQQRIQAVKFSPDSQRIATASADKTVRIWDLDGKELTKLVGHGDWVHGLDFSPKENRLASISDDGTLRIWSTENPFLKKWDSDQAVFSGDKKVFATASENGPVALWRTDGTAIKPLIPKSEKNTAISLSKNGNTIVTRAYDSDFYGPIQLWNGGGKLIKTLVEKQQRSERDKDRYIFGDVSISNNGEIIVISPSNSDSYGPVQLWNRDGKLIKTLIDKKQKLEGEPYISGGVSVSNNGEIIVTVLNSPNSYGPVQLWNRDGKLIKTLIETTKLPEGQNWSYVGVSISRDGKRIVTSLNVQNSYGPVQLWDAAGKLQATLVQPVKSSQTKNSDVEFSEDSQTLLSVVNSLNSSVIKLWQINGTPIKTLVDKLNIQGSVTAVFSRSNDHISPSTIPETVITAVPGEAVRQWSLDGTPLGTITEQVESDQQINKLVLSPDGQILAIQIRNKTIQLWDIKRRNLLRRITADGWITAPSFSSNSQMFAAGSYDNTIRLWNRSTNSVIPIAVHAFGVNQLNFDPDNQYLTSVNEKGKVVLLSLKDITDLNTWFKRGCEKLKNYLQASAKEDEKHLCDGINQ